MDRTKRKKILEIVLAIVICVIIVAIPLGIKLASDRINEQNVGISGQNSDNGELNGEVQEESESPDNQGQGGQTLKPFKITISISAENVFSDKGQKYIDKIKRAMGDELFNKLNNGIILEETELDAYAYNTVRDITRKIEKDYGIVFSGSDDYISAINGLGEKMAGTYSGWIYYVNGGYANVGVGTYQVKAGDCIKFVYILGE